MDIGLKKETNLMEKKEVVRTLITKVEIDKKVTQLARQISRDYKDKNPFFVCLLKGGWVFSADLLRKIKIPAAVDFLMVSSYEDKTTSTGRVEIKSALSTSIAGKDVLIIEDIVDSGLTVSKIKEYLYTLKPKSVKICTLLDKPARRRVEVELDYVGFEIPDKFVVGYGIDYANKYRQLPYIGYIESPEGMPLSEQKQKLMSAVK